MELIRCGLEARVNRPIVVCMGCFDGIHIGHQELLSLSKQIATEKKVLSACLSFEPYPKQYFAKKAGHAVLPRLTRCRDKYALLKEFAIDCMLISPFNKRVSSLSAQAFVHDVLHEQLQVIHIIVGEDFRFGYRREAGVDELRSLCADKNIDVTIVSPVLNAEKRVSSTQVREALLAGRLGQVRQLLGREYAVSGIVRHGQKRGRLLGFPTANVHLPPNTLPMRGVFVVNLIRSNGDVLPAVANVGAQPTVNQHHVRLEVHCLEFEGDLYDEHVRVVILYRLRDVMRFDGLDALKAQIALDKKAAEDYFKQS